MHQNTNTTSTFIPIDLVQVTYRSLKLLSEYFDQRIIKKYDEINQSNNRNVQGKFK